MSTRERWIVYPILFLTLGIAMRDKVVPPKSLQARAITTPRLRCNELQVGQIVCDQVRSRHSECQEFQVNGPNNQAVVKAGIDNNNHAGVIETLTVNGLRQVRLFSNDAGGMVTTVERGGQLALILGDTGQNFGLFAELAGLNQLIPLSQAGTRSPAVVPHPTKKPKN
jgi:hypothetical protein